MKTIVSVLILLFSLNILAEDWRDGLEGEINFDLTDDPTYLHHLESMNSAQQFYDQQLELERQVRNNISHIEGQIRELENYISQMVSRISELEDSLQQERSILRRLERSLDENLNLERNLRAEYQATLKDLRREESKLNRLEQRLAEIRAERDQIEQNVNRAASKVERIEKDLVANRNAQTQKTNAIRSHKQTIASNTREIQRLREQISSNNSEIRTLESEIRSLESELAQLKSGLSSTQQTVRNAQNTYNSKKTNLDNKKKELSSVQSQLSSAKAEKSKLESEKSSLNSQIKSAKDAIRAAQNSITSLKSQISKLNSEINSLKASLSGLESKVSSARTKMQNAMQTCRQNSDNPANCKNDSAVVAARNEMKAAQKELAKAKRQIESKQSRVSEFKTKISSHESTVSSNITKLSSLNSKLPTVESKLTTARSKVTSLTAEVNKVKGLVARLQTQVNEAKAALDSAQSTLENLKREITRVENNIRTKKTRLARLRDQNSSHQSKTSSLQSEQTRLNQQVSSLERELNQLVSEESTLNNRLRSAKSELRSLETQLASAQTRVNNMRGQVRDGRAVVSQISAHLDRLTNDINTTVAAIESLRRDVNQTTSNIQTLNQDIAQSSSDLSGARSDLSNARTDLSNAKNELTRVIRVRDNAYDDLQSKIGRFNVTQSELINSIHEQNRKGLQDAIDPADREGKELARELGSSMGASDGERDGINDGTRAGQRRDYKIGYDHQYPKGLAQGEIDGLSDGQRDGTIAGNRIAAKREGHADGVQRAIDSDALSNGTKEGKKQGLELATKDGKVAGTKLGTPLGIEKNESVKMSQKVIHGDYSIPFKETFSANIPSYPGSDYRYYNSNPGRNRDVLNLAYHAGYRISYDSVSEREFNSLIASIYNQYYRADYERNYNERFARQYPESERQGEKDGYADGHKKAYAQFYKVNFDKFEKQFDQFPNRVASEYTSLFATTSRNSYAVKYKEIYDKAVSDFKASEYAYQLPIQTEKFKNKEITRIDRLYHYNSVLKFKAVDYEDGGFADHIAAKDEVFQPGEQIVGHLEIINYGGVIAQKVMIESFQGKKFQIDIPGKGVVKIYGAFASHINQSMTPTSERAKVSFTPQVADPILVRHFQNPQTKILVSTPVKTFNPRMPFEVVEFKTARSLQVGDINEISIKIKNSSNRAYLNTKLELDLSELGEDNIILDINNFDVNKVYSKKISFKINDPNLAFADHQTSMSFSQKSINLSKRESNKTFVRLGFLEGNQNIILVDTTSLKLPREYFDLADQLGGVEKVSIVDSFIYKDIVELSKKLEDKNIFVVNTKEDLKKLTQLKNALIFSDLIKFEELPLVATAITLNDQTHRVFASSKLLLANSENSFVVDMDKLEKRVTLREILLEKDEWSELNPKTVEEVISNPELKLMGDRSLFKLNNELLAVLKLRASNDLLEKENFKQATLGKLYQLAKDKKGLRGLAPIALYAGALLEKGRKTISSDTRKLLKRIEKAMKKGARKNIKRKLRKKLLEERVFNPWLDMNTPS